MSRSGITAAAFGLTAGEPIDVRTVLHVDALPDAHGRRLLISTEPLEPSQRGFELARLSLEILRDHLAAGGSLPPAVALIRAFEAANVALLDENRPLAGCRWDRRVYIGATAAIVAGRTLTIAQVPATQALVVQDRQLYAFPDLTSWCADYRPPNDQPEPDPLGYREGTRPWLYHTITVPGDLVVLCSSTLARHLARDAAAGLAPDPEALLLGDVDAALEHLAAVVVAHDLDDAYSASVVVNRPPGSFAPLDALRDGFERLRTAWSPISLGAAVRPRGRARTQPIGATGHQLSRRVGSSGRQSWAGVGIAAHQPTPAREPWPAGASHQQAALARPTRRFTGAPQRGGRWRQIIATFSRRSAPRRSPVARGVVRPRGLVAPGAGSVRRYTPHSSVPAEWRANLPRGPEVRIPTRMMTVVLLSFLVFGGSGVAFDRHQDRLARLNAALSVVDGQLKTASSDSTLAPDALLRAQTALSEADAAGAGGELIQARQYAIDATFTELLGAGRLTDPTWLGNLPATFAGRPVQLVRAGSEILVVCGGLYQLDSEAHRLVQLLTPGEMIDGETVGELRSAAGDAAGVVVSDGVALYTRDATGRWQRRRLGLDDRLTGWPAMPAATYQGSYYGLTGEGRVVKFAADALDAAPISWVDQSTYPDLATARDLVIDGRVHVLLADGRVLTFLRGVLETTLAPNLAPAMTAPVAFDGGADTDFLYVVDAGATVGSTQGRIVRLGDDGSAWQILPPIPHPTDPTSTTPATTLATARDLIVDEAAGVVYIVTDRGLWRATLPVAPPTSTL